MGIVFGAIVKKFNPHSKVIYLNDEIPNSNDYPYWRNAEKKHALKSDIVIVPE